jgi:hypothetical protein
MTGGRSVLLLSIPCVSSPGKFGAVGSRNSGPDGEVPSAGVIRLSPMNFPTRVRTGTALNASVIRGPEPDPDPLDAISDGAAATADMRGKFPKKSPVGEYAASR